MKPKKLYYVEILPGGKPLEYRQKGGGTYANLNHANNAYEALRRYGSNVRLYETTTTWDQVTFDAEV